MKYFITENLNEKDLKIVHQFLTHTYWAKDRSFKKVLALHENSTLSFGVKTQNGQAVGYARVLSDLYHLGHIYDVFVLPEHRDKGLGKMIMKYILEHQKFQKVAMWILQTRDAQFLYKKFGFKTFEHKTETMFLKTGKEI